MDAMMDTDAKMDIEDTVVLITGASSGIGAATARAAAKEGARLVLAARRTDRIQALAAELPDAVAVTTDVTDPAQVRAAVEAGLDRYGRIDVLVNNAGQGLYQQLERVDAEDFRAILELNVVAPLVAMQAVIPPLPAQGRGRMATTPPVIHSAEQVAEAILALVRSGAEEVSLVPEWRS